MIILLLATACALYSNAGQAADYVVQLQPVLFENAALADRVLALSVAVSEKKATPDQVRKAWDDDIVPLAEHLHAQVSFVQPPSAWAESHAQLVDLWGDRAAAYRSLSIATDEGDEKRWREARALADGVKLHEEDWFRSTNQRLAGWHLSVDPYP